MAIFNQEGQNVNVQVNSPNKLTDDEKIDIEYHARKAKIKIRKGDTDSAISHLEAIIAIVTAV